MNRAFFAGLLGWMAVAVPLNGPAQAAEAQPARTLAVLVGISDFADKEINSRPRAEADAKALYEVLSKKEHLTTGAGEVRLLLGKPDAKSQVASKKNILEALDWLKNEAKPDDLVIFAYFGQGASLGERGDRRCYFASDSTLKGRNDDAVAASSIGERLDALKSNQFCAFIDLNFKGFTTKESIPEASLGTPPYKEFLGDDGSEDHAPKPGRAVFLATNGLATSLDLPKHGIFAQVILDAFKGGAEKEGYREGYEADGFVTVDELVSYFEKELGELARQHGKTKEEKEQFFVVLGGRSNHFGLVRNPHETDRVEQRQKGLAQLAADKKLSPELAEEGKELLTRMPRLEAQRNLRKLYQKLADGALAVDKFTTDRQGILDARKMRRDQARRYAEKVMEAVQMIKEGYVKEVNQGDLVRWAIQGLYRRVDEKIPAEINEKLSRARTMNETDLNALVADARQHLGNREDLDKHKDIDIALQRMMSHLDPYTTYIDPEMMARVDQEIQGHFTGIGIQIRKNSATDMLQVVTPIKGSPAYRAGVEAGDVITKIIREVDSKGKKLDPPEEKSTKGMPLSDAVKLILGTAGTKVKVEVDRDGEKKIFEITRARIEVESVMGYRRKSDASWDYIVDSENKIGYVRLTSFARNTFRDLETIMRDLKKQGVKAMVLDLRFNPGGLLDIAAKVSDLFIDDGRIVSIRPRAGREVSFDGRSEDSYLGFPMVCMVNGQSASGSEIVAACLQDHGRAKIFGERSYGKGSVQNIQPFEGGELKLTTASFWRPNGKNLNKSSTSGKDEDEWGVKPDYHVPLSRKQRDDLAEAQHNSEIIQPAAKPTKEVNPDFKDEQLEKALQHLRDQITVLGRAQNRKAG